MYYYFIHKETHVYTIFIAKNKNINSVVKLRSRINIFALCFICGIYTELRSSFD